MARKYFGTDGIRGTANQFPMTADNALRIGAAAGIGSPSTVTVFSAVTVTAGVTSVLPSTATRPAEIQRSASRREHSPARASILATRLGFCATGDFVLAAMVRDFMARPVLPQDPLQVRVRPGPVINSL